MMYDGYGGEDEDTRRQRREEENPYNTGGSAQPTTPSWWPSPDYGQTGMGPPESGYGPGGVDNPAYNSGGGITPPAQPVKQETAIDRVPYRDPAPRAPNGPQFQPPQSAPAPMAPAAPAPSVKTPGITDEVTKILMSRLGELKNPQDVSSDPIYQQAVRQNQIGQLRSADRQRKALAERTAATGGTTRSGGFNVGVQGINERAGESAAQYRSGLALDRLTAREQQLSEYIKMARAVGQDDIANQLELQRLQLQEELGRGDLALRSELGRGQLGLGYDNLGFNYADLVTRANRDATLAALQGGG